MISCIIWCCWMTWFLCVFVVGMVSFPYICLVCLLWFVKKLCMLVHCMIWPWYLLLCRLCWLSWPLLQGHAMGWIGDLVCSLIAFMWFVVHLFHVSLVFSMLSIFLHPVFSIFCEYTAEMFDNRLNMFRSIRIRLSYQKWWRCKSSLLAS